MKRHLKYVKHPDGRESFITRQYWSKCSNNGRPLPGHLILVSTDQHTAEVIRVPSPFRGFHKGKAAWKVEEDMWNRMCSERGYVWWSYLTPTVLPPSHPTKKHYSEGEFGGHVSLKITVQDQEVF